MATPTTSLSYHDLAARAASFFKAVDARDIDGVLSHFAPNATFTVQTDHVTFTGVDEIRSMFDSFINNSRTLLHEIENTSVDEKARKVATEQRYIGELLDGTQNDMHNCNFFDIGPDGKFTRVIVWMAGRNPLNSA
ncbi:hypothetical protein EYZ11_004876 [Aspergillus tanneri]|uniref:SnoaL-like domain-containing protein n=1 Tax=Aspergillus tanneri TaxID=1220188 RepID=A0A4S3JJM9_9EURO|nr:uncharacterized protein ATNIH1004_002201 [Aspergillus tanneri]KAA8649530.1 hypothetical protein ATNIH1004_002201 [Aspergillus tanneri]THC95663.1 hypothetical protein EYZ11_004876 [Aspergillus tanneri]